MTRILRIAIQSPDEQPTGPNLNDGTIVPLTFPSEECIPTNRLSDISFGEHTLASIAEYLETKLGRLEPMVVVSRGKRNNCLTLLNTYITSS